MRQFTPALFALLVCGLSCSAPTPEPEAPAQAKRVKILRDRLGIPHVFGESDADVAFGLAFAHAEDDFPTIQRTLIMTRGRLGEIEGEEGAKSDFLVALLRVHEAVSEGYARDLSPGFRAVAESYAEGLDYYARLHPDELVLPELLPFRGEDVVAGFVHKLPIFQGLLREIEIARRDASDEAEASRSAATMPRERESVGFSAAADVLGSNAFAISGERSSDGRTHLAVNSHQPWEGVVAWYEAHLVSGEGMNVVGGLFPGSPMILHGHNDRLGWAHTVNQPDMIDVYRLVTSPDHPEQYLLDGAWRDFESRPVTLRVRIFGIVPLSTTRLARWSVHGPVLELGEGDSKRFYAFRIAGAGDVRIAEQWWRLGKAKSRDEWLAAMRMQAIPMFNTVYADAEGHIGYVYNARLPIREPGIDWAGVAPGDSSKWIWNETLAFEDLPQRFDPPSGFVQNANSTPFSVAGPRSLDASAWPSDLGIETRETERSLRLLTLLDGRERLSEADFERIKWDRRYDGRAWLDSALETLLSAKVEGPAADAQAVLRRFDRELSPDSREAGLAVMLLAPYEKAHHGRGPAPPDPAAALEEAAVVARAYFDRIDPTLGEVQRLRRGAVDLPLGGGPDVLAAIYSARASDRRLVGDAGDSYVLLVSFGPDGVRSRAIQPYGSSSRPASPHFADQAPLFVRQELRAVWRTPEEIRANLEAEYDPGPR
jgi:acyl-homoserine lactone acylase PvdQ